VFDLYLHAIMVMTVVSFIAGLAVNNPSLLKTGYKGWVGWVANVDLVLIMIGLLRHMPYWTWDVPPITFLALTVYLTPWGIFFFGKLIRRGYEVAAKYAG